MNLEEHWQRVQTEPSDIIDHLPQLHQLVIDIDARHVIELGVRWGTSTVMWLHALEQTGGHLTSVDINPAPDWLQHPRWTFIQGDDMDDELIERVPDADIVFIDTSHHYAHTLAELNWYSQQVRPGGVIVCHDTEVQR